MKSVTFYKDIETEVEIDVDIYDVWDKMSEEDKREFTKKEGYTKLSSKNVDEWQDFVYMLSHEEVQNIMIWMNFYNKISEEQK